MLDRRQFTFASLVALVSPAASASSQASIIPEAMPEVPPQAPSSPMLVPSYVLHRRGAELQIDVALRNVGNEALDVLVGLGSRPGPQLTVHIADGAMLEEIVEVGRRDVMSRIGPMPRYAPLASGESVDVGTYRFAWKASAADPVLDVSAVVYTAGERIELPFQRLTPAHAGA